jgi:GntR family transcriptional regulator
MSTHWNDSQPIYWQLKERTIAMILDGTLNEGDALPSVRTVASNFQLNPITVSKSYQALVDDGLVEKRRGLGMFVREGAHQKLMESERAKFIREEWPATVSRIRQLGLDIDDLLAAAEEMDTNPPTPQEGDGS